VHDLAWGTIVSGASAGLCQPKKWRLSPLQPEDGFGSAVRCAHFLVKTNAGFYNLSPIISPPPPSPRPLHFGVLM
jgi:hypothetical protein